MRGRCFPRACWDLPYPSPRQNNQNVIQIPKTTKPARRAAKTKMSARMVRRLKLRGGHDLAGGVDHITHHAVPEWQAWGTRPAASAAAPLRGR
jgi:hypothetical protein